MIAVRSALGYGIALLKRNLARGFKINLLVFPDIEAGICPSLIG